MVAVQPGSRVLVTGGTGFIGAWVVKDLVGRGFIVKAVVRKESQGEVLVATFPEYKGKVTFVVVPDIIKEGAYDSVVSDVQGVIHLASPVLFAIEDPQDLLGPSLQGTLGMLKSVAKYGKEVKRVVITSSCVSVSAGGETAPYVIPHTAWNEVSPKAVERDGKKASAWDTYQASKVLSEKAALEFMEKTKPHFDLALVLPAWVFGPYIHPVPTKESLGSTLGVYYSILNGGEETEQAATALQGDYVDVRDVAAHHSLALMTEAAGGQRIISSNGTWSHQEFFDAVAPKGLKTPKGHPNSKLTKDDIHFDSSLARELFPGFKWTSFQTSASDMVDSFVKSGFF